MKFLNDVSTGCKVILLAVTLLTFLVVMALMGISGSKSIKDELDRMYTENLTALSLAKDAKTQLVATSRVLLNMAVASDVAARERFVASYTQTIEGTIDLVKKTQAVLASPESHALGERVQAGLTEMRAMQSKALAILVSPDSTPEERALAPGLSKDAAIATDKLMVALCERLEKEAQQKIASAESKYTTSSRVSYVFLLVALVFGMGVSLLIRKAVAPPLADVSRKARLVAEGDLNQTFSLDRGDEIGSLAASLDTMVTTLRSRIAEAEQKSCESAEQSERAREAMREARAAGEKAEAGRLALLQVAKRVEDVAGRLFAATSDLSARVSASSTSASTQSEHVTSSVAAMDQMNSTVIDVARNASIAAEGSENARDKAREGEEVVHESLEAITVVQQASYDLRKQMEQLGEDAVSIGTVLTVISDIADQTNLLALNAAIEAARAGEAGRGFAVVADEVRKLAEKTMIATQEVENAVTGIQAGAQNNIKAVEESVEHLDRTTDLVRRSGDTLTHIVTHAEVCAGQVQAIAVASEEQSSVSEQIARTLSDINMMAEETAAAMTQSTEAVNDLAAQASELQKLVAELRQS